MLTQKMKQPFKTAQPVLFPPLADRAAWESLPGAARWAAAGQAALADAQTAPELPLSLWLQFTRSGDRAKWEHAYFARRRTLCALAMAEAVTNRGTYLPALADLAWRICEESAWQLPAHNSYIRDTPQLPLPDVTRPIIDLFAAETGALIATVCGLLGEALDAYATGLAARLRGEVERRVLTPYRTAHFWWMGNGDEPMCNWTPWCTQNVLLAAAQCAPAEDLPAYVQQAAYSIDCFLKDYGDDGCCSEGAQYYRHAALTMFNALDLLCKMAPGVFDDVWAEPKIRNMAEYIVNMHIAGPYYLNFADCSPLAGARGVREYLFGKRVGSLPLMTLAARDWAAVLAADPDPDRLHHPDDSEGINLFYHIQAAMAEREVTDFAKTAAPAAPHDVWYPSVGILVSRRGAYALGGKAGSNADSHNHNDTGSITVYKDGRPFLIDIGVESYTQKTFSPQRYEIWTMQSAWHNLPTFDGVQQLPGAEYAAREVCTDKNSITGELADAYPPIPGLTTYRRSVSVSEQGITLRDETDYPGTVELTLLTEQKPAPTADGFAVGTLGGIRFDPAAVTAAVTAVPITDPRLRTAWPETIYKITLHFQKMLNLELY